MARRASLIAFLALCTLTGCGKKQEIPVLAVSGTVTLDGEKLGEGFLYFKTIETGAFERFDIKDGKFRGEAQPGKRRVEVIANRPKKVVIDEKEVDVPDNIVDPSFNVQSTLTAEVTPEGPNEFHFVVTRKKDAE
jgi:hypothetical protein